MRRVAEMLDDSPLRTLGMIAAVEINDSAGGSRRANEIVRHAFDRGLFLRPLGSTLYLWPPLTADAETLQRMTAILLNAAEQTR
jgi:adenosylmethionine-8-amino-7-oxononanoate aminotransferase